MESDGPVRHRPAAATRPTPRPGPEGRPESGWLAHAVDHAPLGLAVVDECGHVLDANASLEALLGAPAGSLVGACVSDWMDGAEWTQVRAAVEAAVDAPHAASNFDVRLRLGARERWAHLSLAPTGGARGWAAVLVVEPTTVPTEDEEVQARTWRREVLSWAAEDVHDPATPLLEGLAALRRGDWGILGAEQSEKVAGLQVFARRAEVLLDEVRCAAAIAQGLFRVAPEPDDLRTVIHRACAPFRDAADDLGIEFRVHAQAPMPCALDAARILHVLETLLENAFRHTPPGGGVSVQALQVPQGYEVTVADDGPGLDETQRSQVWAPFAQVHADHQGIGLGLFVARNAVVAHGGSLTVASMPGAGATFRVVLPI